jgi:hypothetical protein
MTCTIAWATVLLLLPIIVIWRLSMSPKQKARYYVKDLGWSQRKTARFLGISRHAVRCALQV